MLCLFCLFFFFKQKTAYEMRISDWSSDVCSSDLFKRFIVDAEVLTEQSCDATALRCVLPGLDQLRSARVRARVKIVDRLDQNFDAVRACLREQLHVFDTFGQRRPLQQQLHCAAHRARGDRKSTSLNSSHQCPARMPSSA